MADDNKLLIQRFYAAFSHRNADEMIACYHKDLKFNDPVFTTLNYTDASSMWRMLCEGGVDLEIELVGCEANDLVGTAEWVAKYTFSATGRPVINRVKSEFQFKEGLIVLQNDTFDLWKWTRMALGAKGILLGWTPLVKTALQAKIKQALTDYQRR